MSHGPSSHRSHHWHLSEAIFQLHFEVTATKGIIFVQSHLTKSHIRNGHSLDSFLNFSCYVCSFGTYACVSDCVSWREGTCNIRALKVSHMHFLLDLMQKSSSILYIKLPFPHYITKKPSILHLLLAYVKC